MDINHQYLLHLAEAVQRERPEARFLDFGCGRGEIVDAGIGRGLNFYGADIFYEPNPETVQQLQARGLLGNRIREIRNGLIPFEKDHFDLIVSCMVFEHVADIDGALAEIARVLKPGGIFVAMFPTVEVWREAHTGLPFLHWFRPRSKQRIHYAVALRSVGLGTFKTRPIRQWVDQMLSYLDNYVHYRPEGLVEASFRRHFSLGHIETHHAMYRLTRAGLRFFSGLLRLPVVGRTSIEAFKRVAYMALAARKPGGGDQPLNPDWLPEDLRLDPLVTKLDPPALKLAEATRVEPSPCFSPFVMIGDPKVHLHLTSAACVNKHTRYQ